MTVVPILMYHSVDVNCAPAYRRWMVTPDRFARHMSALAERGCTPLPMAQLAELLRTETPLPPQAIAITFDDGFRDFKLGALPSLERFGFASTLYVVTGEVGGKARWLRSMGEGDRSMLDWSELGELRERNVEIGAHSVTHLQLDIVSRQIAEDEILGSKAVLEDRLGCRVDSFAYPHGYATAVTRRIVERTGYSSACRVRHALSSTSENRYALSRIIVTEDLDVAGLLHLLDGNNLPVAPPVDRLATHGWRLFRKAESYLRSPA